MPSGLNVTARLRKLLRGSPSSSVAALIEDQAFLRVGDIEVGVERVDRLLFVLGIALARRVHAERGRATRSSARLSS